MMEDVQRLYGIQEAIGSMNYMNAWLMDGMTLRLFAPEIV